jgi:hypothetical protein
MRQNYEYSIHCVVVYEMYGNNVIKDYFLLLHDTVVSGVAKELPFRSRQVTTLLPWSLRFYVNVIDLPDFTASYIGNQ